MPEKIGISNHAKQRIDQRFPQLKNSNFEQTKKYFLQLINQSLVVYYDGTEIVYIGSNFKVVLSADSRHKLVTAISA